MIFTLLKISFRAEYYSRKYTRKCHKNLTYFYVVEDYNGCRLSLFCALGNLRKCDLRLFFDVTPMGKWLRHSPCGFSASLIVFCEVFFVQFFTDGLMNIQTLYVICQIGLLCLQFSKNHSKDFRVFHKNQPNKTQSSQYTQVSI